MAAQIQAMDRQIEEGDLVERAVGLLNQQVWCWGRDIVRAEGNWLLKIGFARLPPPADRPDGSSVYTLRLPRGRCVILRGFGVFFGDLERGGVFLSRFKFQPRFTVHAELETPPWSDSDLPDLAVPTESQRAHCASLTLDLIDWIRASEVNIAEYLGIEYRRSTLDDWNNGRRAIIRAEEMAGEWRRLGVAIAADFRALVPQCPLNGGRIND